MSPRCWFDVAGVSMGGAWGPAAMGAVLGSLYAALNRFGMKRFWRMPHAPLNVVVTGGTKGLGKAIAREFLRSALIKLPNPLTLEVLQLLGMLAYYISVGLLLLCLQVVGRAAIWSVCDVNCSGVCRSGDRVMVSSRSVQAVRKAMNELREEVTALPMSCSTLICRGKCL